MRRAAKQHNCVKGKHIPSCQNKETRGGLVGYNDKSIYERLRNFKIVPYYQRFCFRITIQLKFSVEVRCFKEFF